MTLAHSSKSDECRQADAFSAMAGMSEGDSARSCLRLDERLSVARRHAAALVLARRVDDEAVANVAAARLRRTLLDAIGIVHGATAQDGTLHAILVASFNDATPAMYELLQGPPTNIAEDPVPTCSPRGLATLRWFEVRGGRSHIFELDASGRELREAAVRGLHISRSRFITDLRRAHFTDSLVETSDFSYADLRSTLWQRARVRRCYFREARFCDAAFDDTMFIDCDMRGADFTINSMELSTTPGVTFIRCDLRGAHWGGRDLSGFELFDCQVFDTADRAASLPRPDEPSHAVTPHDRVALPRGTASEDGEVEARSAGLVTQRRTS